MEVIQSDNPKAFRDRVWPLLLEREAENNLMIGLIGRLAEAHVPGAASAGGPVFRAVEERGQIVAAAFFDGPPHRLVLTHAEPEAIELLADDLCRGGITLPGVLGPTQAAERFARLWRRWRGCTVRPAHAMRIYQLDRMRATPPVSGRLVVARPDDFELYRRWDEAFCREIAAHPMPDEVLRRRIAEGTRFLWADPQPVSAAAASGTTPNGVRIGGVYTPGEHRRRGYATALVAALSQRQLDAGRKFCFLFTDLANPTSNSIYQKIGYEPVCDFQEYDFVSAPESGRPSAENADIADH